MLDRPVEGKANTESNQVDSAKLLEYMTKDNRTSGATAPEHKSSDFLPAAVLSDIDSSNLSRKMSDLIKASHPAEDLQPSLDQKANSLPGTIADLKQTALSHTNLVGEQGELSDAVRALKVLSIFAGLGLDVTEGSPTVSHLLYAGVAGFQAKIDFDRLRQQNSPVGKARYGIELALDAGVLVGCAGSLAEHYIPLSWEGQFVREAMVYGGILARGYFGGS